MCYIEYNREERDICAHLFRLLLEDQPRWGPLKRFLEVEVVDKPGLFCEAALLRDAYHTRKPDVACFMDRVCEIIARQEQVRDYTPFSGLPSELNDPTRTHPKQIRRKMVDTGYTLSDGDSAVYGSLQAMCNAKPDLVICNGKALIVYEAKYTCDFDQVQLQRTRQIADLWAELLYQDLGFSDRPSVEVRTLGLARFSPDVSWDTVHTIALEIWGPDDYSVRVLAKALGQ